ncbi:MAG: hypothetical protein FRX49_00704 [Trebouxia sp. A1-2]|nr:MAG: hypothetical protein FRX49_00704 [Trebouxia sp. A1-2]
MRRLQVIKLFQVLVGYMQYGRNRHAQDGLLHENRLAAKKHATLELHAAEAIQMSYMHVLQYSHI